MAFIQAGWGKLSTGYAHIVSGQWYTYTNLADTLADMAGSAYFNDIPNPITVGEVIVVRGSDGVDLYEITAVGPPVTTTGLIGAASIPDGSITTPKLAAAAVTLAKLDAGIVPSHVVKFAGSHTSVGGSPSESISVPGVLGTDLAIVQLETEGASPVTVDAADSIANNISLTFSADPSTDHIVTFMVLRAAV